MRKTATLFFLILFSVSVFSKQSSAAFALYAGYIGNEYEREPMAALGSMVSVIGLALVVVAADSGEWMPYGVIAGGLGVLDEDQTKFKNGLSEFLIQKYPCIADRSVVQRISDEISQRLNRNELISTGETRVRFTAEEMRDLLDPAGLDQGLLTQITTDFL